ncbi:MAG: mandelate racemase/muconate lactonizing enzyme family protein [Planctomycetes bacterium]|nr:mandelate racemase/muconate lactonizing enzyme family protein [Planctomycetota bacterium]
MRITGIRTYMFNVATSQRPATDAASGQVLSSQFKTWLFLKIETDVGICGWGEGSGEWLSPMVRTTLHEWEPLLVGRDPTDIGVLWEDVQNRLPWKGGPVFGSAIAAIDMALHDITGKAWGVPVYKLLGGRRRDRVKVYDGALFFSGSAEDARQMARESVGQGFNGLKGNPLEGRTWPMERREVERCAEILYAVRQEVGPYVELMLDCHGNPSPELALAFARLIADAGPLFIEEPCKVGSVDALAQISERSVVPIAMGEKLFTFREFKEIIDRRACAYLQPDISHSFGLTNFVRVAHAAAEQQMLMAPHNAGGPIYFSALMHADAAIENLLIQEANRAWFRRFAEWADHDWVLKDGFIELNDRPGLGLEIREEAVAAERYDSAMAFRQYRYADGSWKGW